MDTISESGRFSGCCVSGTAQQISGVQLAKSQGHQSRSKKRYR